LKSQEQYRKSWERISPTSWIIGIAVGGTIGIGLLLGFAALLGYLLPWIAAGFVVAAPVEYYSIARRKGTARGLAALEGLRAMVVFPLLTLGLGAPLRAVLLAAYYGYFRHRLPWETWLQTPPIARIFLYWSPFDVIIAACGITFGILATGVTIYLILQQIRQVDNLPTSKTRAAALGLSEFKGVARRVEDANLAQSEINNAALFKELGGPVNDPILFFGNKNPFSGEPITTTHKLSRFYLEDDTGRILVDPLKAQFWDGESASFLEPLCKVLLTRRVQKSAPPLGDTITTASLWAGDPVYVLGYVEMNPDAPRDAVGVDRLIVRPCTAPIRRTLFNWLFFNSERLIRSRDYRYMFLLSDAYEYRVKEILGRGIKSILIPGAIWTFGSLALLLLALKLLG